MPIFDRKTQNTYASSINMDPRIINNSKYTCEETFRKLLYHCIKANFIKPQAGEYQCLP